MDKEIKSVYLKVNPLSIVHGQLPLTSEYRLGLEFVGNRKLSYSIFAAYVNKSPLFTDSLTANNNTKDLEYPGYRLYGQLRYYLAKYTSQSKMSGIMNPSGVYAALQGSYAQAELRFKGVSYPKSVISNFNVLGSLGMQVLSGDNLGIDLFCGMGYKSVKYVEYDYMGRQNNLDLRQAFQGFYGNYLASKLKMTFGFSLVFGLL